MERHTIPFALYDDLTGTNKTCKTLQCKIPPILDQLKSYDIFKEEKEGMIQRKEQQLYRCHLEKMSTSEKINKTRKLKGISDIRKYQGKRKLTKKFMELYKKQKMRNPLCLWDPLPNTK